MGALFSTPLRTICRLWLLGVTGLVWGCAPSRAPQAPLIFAAASLSDVVQEALARFEPGAQPASQLNIAGSNVLARQAIATPGADLFLSADKAWMDAVVSAGRAVPGTVGPVAQNQLVIICNRARSVRLQSLSELPDAVGSGRLALADPEGVPAGRYAKAALKKAGVWRALAERVLPALDVRAALALVERDPSVLGVVYATDARHRPQVRVLRTLPVAQPVEIWGAQLVHLGAPLAQARAHALLTKLRAPSGQALFVAHGFLPLAAAGGGAP